MRGADRRARLGHQVGIEVKERMIPRFLAEVSVPL